MIPLKSERELEGIRESARILSQVLKILRASIGPGIPTRELDRIARKEIAAFGARPAFLGYMDFPAAVCISVNEVVIHGIPDGRRLKEGDIVSIDCGVDYEGFFSDAAFTVPVGGVAEEVRKLLEVTEESLYLGIAQARPGNRIHDVSRAVYRHARAHGLGVVREFCGHGVGLSPHEEPQIPNYVGKGRSPRIMPGMVLAIEPMFTLGADYVRILEDGWSVVPVDGSLSAHFEHTIAVLPDGPEILTDWGEERVPLLSKQQEGEL
ncbi:type I methionyl aminopeptidase [Spirochaeta thermophila]|uniref:Methionine aminopeptidase n=1 Tax=Winmispira thermophila (strain ATCC 49972 / DSM 6192 / RI 19.B1) TaxID=665571 RepID=E0RSE7_WINT6|nr:type I methionyl aminopeptidase [Spirochaeta thermophila]ADN01934.1 methionine aminopeptidase [Spirochaeta thermophila DSM 6192]